MDEKIITVNEVYELGFPRTKPEWDDLSSKLLSEEVMCRYHDRLNFEKVRIEYYISDWFIITSRRLINWDLVGPRQMSEELIDAVPEKICWDTVSADQNLTVKFIKRYYRRLNFDRVIANPSLTIEILLECHRYFDWEKVTATREFADDDEIIALSKYLNLHQLSFRMDFSKKIILALRKKLNLRYILASHMDLDLETRDLIEKWISEQEKRKEDAERPVTFVTRTIQTSAGEKDIQIIIDDQFGENMFYEEDRSYTHTTSEYYNRGTIRYINIRRAIYDNFERLRPVSQRF